MDKDAVIAVLRPHRAELERLGIRHAGLFGSLARGDAGPQSDIDIAIDLDDVLIRDIYTYVGVERRVTDWFEGSVDVVDRASLHQRITPHVDADLIYAF